MATAVRAGMKRVDEDKGASHERPPPPKKARIHATANPVKHALLRQYYPEIVSLRHYLISKLPSASRLRRKKIASIGSEEPRSSADFRGDLERQLCHLLDTTVVGLQHSQLPAADDNVRREEWTKFSQRGDESYVTLSGGLSDALFSQAEIVDFVVWLLFSQQGSNTTWPKHLLCDGFRRNATHAATSAIPGLLSMYPNHHVQALKKSPWPELLMLLGKSGESIMIDLLVDGAMFTPIQAGLDNMYQLSGVPLSELSPAQSQLSKALLPGTVPQRPLSDITFVRSRMMYARAALNTRGLVLFGFRHIRKALVPTNACSLLTVIADVLNRCPLPGMTVLGTVESGIPSKFEDSTRKLLMYVFPRQFGLHNVFSSEVDRRQTTQKFQDYTLREDEIKSLYPRSGRSGTDKPESLPKRLRGEVVRLIQRLQVRHARCSYTELLRHYCPSALDANAGQRRSIQDQPGGQKTALGKRTSLSATQQTMSKRSGLRRKSGGKDYRRSTQIAQQPPQPTVTFETITDLATPVAHVSAFCQAVLAKLIPDDFWGSGSSRRSNKQLVMTKVHHFVKLRRFESLSLSEVASGLKVTDIGWLAPPGLKSQKTSLTDMNKRLEILNEFLYYVFDSLLIPLLRSNFYVTESSVHRYKLFFFRHDIWRYVAEPAMAELKATMFEEVKLDHARRILENRKLGFSQVRLLPKQISMRPITNLRRRAAPIGNKKMLGLSINSILGPVYSALKLEKELDPSKLGASMFSVPDVYRRLNAFKNSLGDTPGKLYFVKLDVKAAFDTIPQDAVLKLMQDVTTQDRYKLLKHVEIKAGHVGGVHKPTRRWQAVAICEHDKTPFLDRVESQLAPTKRHTIFIDNVMQRSEDRRKLLSLMTTHIEQNLVKLGKKYYRQKNGIPQGSVLSSTLCNYFYADLELQHLSFLSGQDCMLSRLIDDFLLITTDVRKARRFVKVMHKGFPDYGVSISPAKTLVNFEMEIDGGSVARLPDGEKFPYCGTLIDCKTLAIGKDRGHIKDTVTSNGLTVEFGYQSGHNFMRKTLNAFKIQSHIMFYDTVHNSPRTVYSNLFESFTETATKMLAYAKCLGPNQRPAPRMVIRTISKVIDVAWVLLTSKTRRARFPDYRCELSKHQVAWLALHAVRKAVARKQSAYHDVLEWIAREIRKLQFKKEIRDVGMLQTFEDVAS
ncbi:hypothetical protein VdG1_06567 [Verticillium dahliae VDG1]|nr:hypothetical protein VdG1_06567 [Verticillium dahliae VDG1]